MYIMLCIFIIISVQAIMHAMFLRTMIARELVIFSVPLFPLIHEKCLINFVMFLWHTRMYSLFLCLFCNILSKAK